VSTLVAHGWHARQGFPALPGVRPHCPGRAEAAYAAVQQYSDHVRGIAERAVAEMDALFGTG
jgi:hypothetical protein